MSMEIGARLQRARIDRVETLRQISDATKISPRVLELIERNDFDHLPKGICTRGHLRAFAARVGLEPEEIVHEYVARHCGSTPEEPQEPPTGVDPTHLVRLVLMLVLGAILVVAFLLSVDLRSTSPDTADIEAVVETSRVLVPIPDRPATLPRTART
jgi:cytoskeletal protein RodZ